MYYKKACFTLFNEVTNAIDYLDEDFTQPQKDRIRVARNILMLAQTLAEMLIISQPSGEDEVKEEDEVSEED